MEELLPYYERELAYLRRYSEDFCVESPDFERWRFVGPDNEYQPVYPGSAKHRHGNAEYTRAKGEVAACQRAAPRQTATVGTKGVGPKSRDLDVMS